MATDDQLQRLRQKYRDLVRVRRPVVLAALDHQINDAADRAQDTKDLRGQRVVLRDAPTDPAIDSARTPADLAAIWPPALGAFPADAFRGWDARPERPGKHVVVDLSASETVDRVA